MGINIKAAYPEEEAVFKTEPDEVARGPMRNQNASPDYVCADATLQASSSFAALRREIHSDYRRYRATGARNPLAVIALTQGFWASTVFRVSHWLLLHSQARVLRVIVNAICLLLQKAIEILTGISIPAGCEIGRGLYIGHFGGIFVDSQCRLGENCNVAQGVTIGQGGRGDLAGVPVLGDRVHVGTNAVILGRITIGNDAVIGPGAVVMRAVPPCGVVMGNPARVVGFGGSFDIVNYDDMQNDPARKLALQNQPHRTPAGGGAWNE
ncbi:MAG TPA: hypothetical protein VL361_08270 [Candidatus Limnocylindrales bacterium]|jgi:serine O-acetyltransferase|nr:hypothetical protein [Candidatus Limnocylindrales bacterium]